MRRLIRSGPQALAASVLIAGLAAPPALAYPELRVGRPVDLGDGLADMIASPGGTIRAAVSKTIRGRSRDVITTFSRGAAASDLVVNGSPVGLKRRDGNSTVLTSTGFFSALRARDGSRIGIVGYDGSTARSVSGAIPLTTDELQAFAGGRSEGVLFATPLPHRRRQAYVAIRPGGHKHFRAPVAIDAPADLGRMRYSVAFGPRGNGAVVAQPAFADYPGQPVRVRRIARDGSLGPWIPVGLAPKVDGVAEVAVARDGSIALAMVEEPGDVLLPAGATVGASAHLLTAALLPGQAATTPVQDLAIVGESFIAFDNLAVAFGLGEQVVVADGAEFPDRVIVASGPAGSLVTRGSFSAHGPSGMRAVVTHDGGITVVWGGNRDGAVAAIYGSHGAARGPMSPPRRLVNTAYPRTKHFFTGEIRPQILVATSGAESALAYTDETGGSDDASTLNLVRLRP